MGYQERDNMGRRVQDCKRPDTKKAEAPKRGLMTRGPTREEKPNRPATSAPASTPYHRVPSVAKLIELSSPFPVRERDRRLYAVPVEPSGELKPPYRPTKGTQGPIKKGGFRPPIGL